MSTVVKSLAQLAMCALFFGCASKPAVEQSRESKPASAATKPADTVAPSATPPAITAPVPKKGGGFYKDDGPGDTPPPDMASIPDATPQLEPLHRFANRPYSALGQSFVPLSAVAPFKQTGVASWYGRRFHGARTSSGERYDMYGMTAAHPTLPIPSYVRVTRLENGKSVVVRINDRGPFHNGRVIDLSYTAAWKLGYVTQGSTRVEVEALVPEGVNMVGAPATPAAQSVPQPAAIEVPAEAGTAKAVPPPIVSGIYLQLGSFNSQRNADDFRDYAKHELSSVKQTLHVMEEGERFKLQLGPFASESAARDIIERIAAKLKLKPFIVRR